VKSYKLHVTKILLETRSEGGLGGKPSEPTNWEGMALLTGDDTVVESVPEGREEGERRVNQQNRVKREN